MSTDEILLAGKPEVPSLRFRHFHAPDDFAGMAAANQASRDAAGQEAVVTAEAMSTPPPTDLAVGATETDR